MRIINTSVCAFQNKVLVIGFEGENERTQVRIDASEVFTEYPHATPSLTVKPYSGEAYPAMVNRDGTDVVWDITSGYLTERGESEIQLTFIKDSVVCKSYIGKALILRSLTVEGEMPTPVESWVDAANAKLAEVDAQIVELEGMVDTATDAATRAEQSASTASTKAEQAAGSAATATEKATEATNAAGTATAKAAEAEQSALTATEKATAAAESERIATAKAGEATTAAGTATAKAGQATEAAQTATEKAGDASASARAAQESATDAASSATAASESETAAKASETAASTSATQAAQSVMDAGANAQTAMQKAAEASQSASNAATSATNAATSAETASTKAGEAAQSAQAASDAKTAVEQTAEQLAESLEQIEQNTQDIAELDERKANVDGYYPDMTVGNAEQLNSSKYVENSEPYTLRTSGGSSDIGNREYLDAVVGGTVAWNQLVPDADGGEESITITLESGKKYLSRISGTDSMLLGSGQEITAAKGTDNVFDLTQMFGTAVADYVYGQGASFFRKWFGGSHYPYNAGELLSVEGLSAHEMVGFNLLEDDAISGTYPEYGNRMSNEKMERLIPQLAMLKKLGQTLYYRVDSNRSTTQGIPIGSIKFAVNGTLVAFTIYPNAQFVLNLLDVEHITGVYVYGATPASETILSNVCISLAHNGSRNGEYEPYEKHSYPLDSSVILRGIPKVGANGVYWDGDRYLPDGTVERRYGVLVCDGTVNYNTPSIVGNYSRIQVNFVNGAGKLTYPQAIASWLDRIVSFSLESNHFYCNDLGAVIIVETSIIGSTAESVRAFFAAHPLEIVYELATPTTETAQPYHSTQWVSDWGTEEFVSTGIVPVGSETRYPANLRDKLQHLPDAASGNGSYLITQTDGQMVLTPFPAPPSTAGNYVLKATVVNGVATYTWEVAT